MKLSGVCQKRLSQAEKKIEMLTRSLDGSLKKVPFEYDEKGSAGDEAEKSVKKSRKVLPRDEKPSTDDEDLLF